MIDFPLEEAEVFDRLTILLIKVRKTIDPKISQKLLEQAYEIEDLLNQKLGYDKARNISKSKEFNDLFDVNLRAFDDLNNDLLNSEKNKIKQKLQNLF